MSSINSASNLNILAPLRKNISPLSVKNYVSSQPIVSCAEKNIPPEYNRFITAAESDPLFAKQMAKDFAFTPDKLLVDLSKVPSPSNVQAWGAWESQFTSFDKVAEKVTSQRIDIFNEMKTSGAPDADIYKAILSFNSSLPLDYQLKSGFLKNIDMHA